MKVELCIIWMIVSAALVGKGMEEDKLWLILPFTLSTSIALIMFVVELVLSFV